MGPEAPAGSNGRYVVPAILAILTLITALCVPGTAAAEPVARPALTVTPSTGLHHGSVVTVSGSGYRAGAPLFLVETIRVPIARGIPLIHHGKKRVTADRTGKFTTTLTVLQRFGHINCAVTGCYIATVSGTLPGAILDRSLDASAPITFGDTPNGNDTDPNARGVRPELTLEPASGLQEGTAVTVTGRHFPAATPVNVVQTIVRPENGRPTLQSDPIPVTTDAQGSFTTSIKVSPKIKDTNCLRTDCFIAAYPVTAPAAQDNRSGTEPRTRNNPLPELSIVRGHDAWAPLVFDGSDLTKLSLEAESIAQADSARINITGAQPLDLYRIEVDGPGEFSAQPWVRADEHGNASVLLMSNFDQPIGPYTVRLTTDRTDAVSETKFSVSTNAFFDPAQHEGMFQEIENRMPPAGPSEEQLQAQADAAKRSAWTSWWYVVAGIAALVGFGILGWFARDKRRRAQP
ncbi:MAG: neocarzinostatin apoprotein domain-containing protein [Gordonia sp. (in: high G+C Gram-positive bacteria)]|uniref:neocarzinostatin apoprotein domain-containing protein n=1 Tax=Gordonia sp. (in: high G+C Gram-positive bacteria) TaxID=84139 RepID=UPI003BB79D31